MRTFNSSAGASFSLPLCRCPIAITKGAPNTRIWRAREGTVISRVPSESRLIDLWDRGHPKMRRHHGGQAYG